MAIGRGTANSSQATAASSISFSVTVSGSNTYIGAQVGWSKGGGAGAISTATYNSVALTNADTETSGTDIKSAYYYKENPSAGANTLSVTWGANQDEIGLVGVPRTGVNQSTPIGTPAKANVGAGSDVDPTVVVTSASGEVVEDSAYNVRNSGAATQTVGAGQTSIAEEESIGAFGALGVSEEAGAASVTMSWTGDMSTVFGWAIVGVPIKPAAGGATGKSNPLHGPLGGPLSGGL